MQTERVTVTMPADQVEALRRAVAAGDAESVSSYVADAVRQRLARDQALVSLETVLGGRPPEDALNWARQALGVRRIDDGPSHGQAQAS
jgi:antitoxin ParD1/3/4